MKYNSLMDSHFRNCPKIAEMADPHRNRTVSIFFLGEESCVGVSDGTDSWISAPEGIRSIDLHRPLREAMSGRFPADFQPPPTQRKKLIADQGAPIQRKKLIQRRRLI